MWGLYPAPLLVQEILSKSNITPTDNGEKRILDLGRSISFASAIPSDANISQGVGQVNGTSFLPFAHNAESDMPSRALAMAQEFPHARVVALDFVRKMEDQLPSNLTFELHDMNDGLASFYDSYDIVHARCVGGGLKSYRALLDEAYKCLKPGGVAIFLEGDLDLFEEDQKTIVEPASEENPNGSYLQRWLQRNFPFGFS